MFKNLRKWLGKIDAEASAEEMPIGFYPITTWDATSHSKMEQKERKEKEGHRKAFLFILGLVFVVSLLIYWQSGFTANMAILKSIFSGDLRLWSLRYLIIPNPPSWMEPGGLGDALWAQTGQWIIFAINLSWSISWILMVIISFLAVFLLAHAIRKPTNEGATKSYKRLNYIVKDLSRKGARLWAFLKRVLMVALEGRTLFWAIIIWTFNSGFLLTFVVNFFITYFSYFYYLAGDSFFTVFVWSQIKAIWIITFNLLFNASIGDLIKTFIILYSIIAVIMAYLTYDHNDESIEEFIDKYSGVGNPVSGASGTGKTFTLHALASASQRLARKKVAKWLNNCFFDYNQYINFYNLTEFFNTKKARINNQVQAEELAKEFIAMEGIDAEKAPDRFLGRSPTLGEVIRWYFIGLYFLSKDSRVISNYPGIISDPSAGHKIRNNLFDFLTRRRANIPALVLNENAFKSKTKSKLDTKESAKRKAEILSDFKPAYILESGATIVFTEADKDWFHGFKSALISSKTGDIMAVIRHYLSFDSRDLGRFFYDSQADNGVAMIIRERFDTVLQIDSKFKVRHSHWLAPYIFLFDIYFAIVRFFKKEHDHLNPYKRSALTFFLDKINSSLWIFYRFLCSFDFVKVKLRKFNSKGALLTNDRNKFSFKVNVADVFNNYKSVTYYDAYVDNMRDPSIEKVLINDLPKWDQFNYTLNKKAAEYLHSEFIDSVIYPDGKDHPNNNFYDDFDPGNQDNFWDL